ncbi:MAG: ATP-binding cassette domain-containing protein [Candidatus Thorarchaeota archaeon]|nr:ATP-binding cassette domain-containing protein [Candidatus Thorarchaeota archaeon]
MKTEKEIIKMMSGPELIRLAQVLRVPLTRRHISRTLIEQDLVDAIEAKNSDKSSVGQCELKNPAIEITRMRKEFGRKVAVKDLDLIVRPGEIVGLVGPNGAGKTTTLRVLTGIIKPTYGDVFVNGHNMASDPVSAKMKIGYIPERPTCYPSLKVIEYLTFIARIYDVPRVDALLRIREYVDRFQLDEFLTSYIGTLSKGNLQRTLLAGIFVREPPFILALDEPIYGLDPRGAWSLKAHLKDLKKDGSAILVSTHILEVAEGLCDRFFIMNHGDIVGQGSLTDLKDKCPGTNSLEEVFLTLTGGIPKE